MEGRLNNTEEKPMKTSPKDFFLHLLAIATLYGAAASFITLIFQYINVWFPDALQYRSYYGPDALASVYSTIRLAISSLVVTFPVYVGTSWVLNKGYEINPEKRDLRIRKWLIYFTLFASAIIIMGDLVTLINTFLGGGITSQFILKIITVLTVVGAVFAYYLWDLRKYKTE